MTDNLSLTQVVPASVTKEDQMNDKGGELDAAVTESLTVDLSAGGATLTAAQYQRNKRFVTSGLTTTRTLTLAAVKRDVIIDNTDGIADLTVAKGATSLTVPAGAVTRVYTDGTTDGLVATGSTVALTGSTAVEDFIFVPVEERVTPTASGGCAALATVATSANHPDVTSLDFDQTTAEHAQLRHVFGEVAQTGNVSLQFMWSHASGGSSFGVAWVVKGVNIADDGTIDVAFGPVQTAHDTGGTANDHHTSPKTGYVKFTSAAALDRIVLDVSRDPTDPADTLDLDARLEGILVWYWKDKPLDTEWANVELLFGADGPDADTTVGDESDNLATATYNGNAQCDDAQAKFERRSLLLDGTGDYVTFPDSVTLELGSGNFCLEGWVRWNTDPAATQVLFGKWTGTGNQRSYMVRYDSASADELQLLLSNAGTDTITKLQASFTPTLSQWYHVAADFDGTNYRLFVDGVLLVSAGTPVTLFGGTSDFAIGAEADGTTPFDGWIDEVRLTKASRYTVDFVPPASPFPRG